MMTPIETFAADFAAPAAFFPLKGSRPNMARFGKLAELPSNLKAVRPDNAEPAVSPVPVLK